MFELNKLNSIKVGLASPETIRSWSHGEVKKPETINYRSQKPEPDGLFCEKIFGPSKDYECHCGKYKKPRYQGIVCEKCGVEVTSKAVRRERMGHIELASPCAHIWYLKGIPSRMGLLLNINPKQLDEVVYFVSHVVLNPGTSKTLQYREVLDDKTARQEFLLIVESLINENVIDPEDPDYQRALNISEALNNVTAPFDFISISSFISKYTGAKFGMGAEAVQQLLEEVNLDDELKSIQEELRNTTGSKNQKRQKLIKRLEVVQAFRHSHNKPSWMILNALPVIPPDLRPMLQLDGGRFATSDLNELYRRVITRNIRLKKMIDLKSPSVILINEKRMLQEAVDALIDNGRRSKPVTGAGNRPLKSLSSSLKGKSGRFRQNLLGKRVDFSGRSVIAVGPTLKMYECGIPREMAIQLFRPFIASKLIREYGVSNHKVADQMIDSYDEKVFDVIEQIITKHPVLLNRAPTLHRLGIQAFKPILVEGRAIRLHPLVCTGFNADFDGDQMAIHVPLSPEAQAESRYLMLSVNNLLKPQDGKPVTVPTQDMILGAYYLTMEVDGEPGEGNYFESPDEAVMAYVNHDLGMHAKIYVRITKEIDGELKSKKVETTVGRLIYNEGIPQDLGFVDRTNPDTMFDPELNFTVMKKNLGKIIAKCINVHGLSKTAELLDYIKSTGYKYSTIAGMTVSVDDVKVPPAKKQILADANVEVDKVLKQYKRGLITDQERYNSVIKIWEAATDKVTEAMKDNFDRLNPVYMMSESGARGNVNQLRQIAGMRGLMASTTGKTVEIPITSSFREGLDALEYFISAHGARKGLADTALRTADSGYLTRRLVDVSQDIIVREPDCGTHEGIEVADIKDGNQVVEKMVERLIGRYPLEDVIDPNTNKVIVDTETLITENIAEQIVAAGITSLKVRSVLGCRTKHGVCAKCYGMGLATREEVNIGESVGIIAAQSIGEPGTQLTMRTIHSGGVAGVADITQGLPRVEELFEARKPKGLAIVSEINGVVKISEEKTNKEVTITSKDDSKTYTIPFGSKLRVRDGEEVKAGQPITEGSINPNEILAINGADGVYQYLIQEVQKVYRNQGVDINDKHIEVIGRQMLKKVRVEDNGDTELFAGSLVDIYDVEKENDRVVAEGGRPATYKRVLLGITKASLATESFLSAASFQETTRVLTEAAVKGKVDELIGLKENVIIGKLIPAGTGLNVYKNIHINTEKEPEKVDTTAEVDQKEETTIEDAVVD